MIVALLNQKGGVGKTTLALHLAGRWAGKGKRVLVVDADPQGSALDWSEQRAREQLPRLFGVLGLARETLHRELPALAADADHVIVDGRARAMSGRDAKSVFSSRPSDADAWVRTPDARAEPAVANTARLTIDVTPALRGRIKVTAFGRGLTVADMLRALGARIPGAARPLGRGVVTANTRVELLHLEGKVERWIRFGRHAHEEILDRRRRALWFAPGAVFAFVRWSSGDYGTLVSRIDILRACDGDQPITTVPGVTPGAESLLRISGWQKVEQVLAAIDQVEAIDLRPEDACPDHWRHVHNRITAGERPRPYALDRHRAWLMRRRIEA